jgi:hypothetical protein
MSSQMLNSPYISGQFPNGTLIAGIGLFIVRTYYVRVSRSLKQISETPATPDAPYQSEKPSWPELRYLQWGVCVSVVFFMFVGAADTGGDWLLALTGCLLGFCAALFSAMLGVGFVSLFNLWQELVSQFMKAKIRSLLLSFPLAIFWLVLGLAVTAFFGMVVEKIPMLPQELLWGLIAMVFGGLWMGRSHAALMFRGILMVSFTAIVVVAVAFGYWWIVRQTALLLVLFLSAIGALNIFFYSRWVRLKALQDNMLKPPDPA